jgi:hypothetical protein
MMGVPAHPSEVNTSLALSSLLPKLMPKPLETVNTLCDPLENRAEPVVRAEELVQVVGRELDTGWIETVAGCIAIEVSSGTTTVAVWPRFVAAAEMFATK